MIDTRDDAVIDDIELGLRVQRFLAAVAEGYGDGRDEAELLAAADLDDA